MDLAALAPAFFAVALLYASVGHGGASGYLAIMALAGTAPEVMRPTALALNVAVTAVGTALFARARQLDLSFFWPFALGSIPLAYVGGSLALPAPAFKLAVAAVLLAAALRLAWAPRDPEAPRPPPRWTGVLVGATLGLLAGLTGTGGGIFLTPLALLAGWAGARRAAATSSAFILVNSIAGLAGNPASLASASGALPVLLAAVVLGGALGSWLGARRLAPAALRRLLAAVLVIAAVKLGLQ